jgi:hypothetical protein
MIICVKQTHPSSDLACVVSCVNERQITCVRCGGRVSGLRVSCATGVKLSWSCIYTAATSVGAHIKSDVPDEVLHKYSLFVFSPPLTHTN